MLFTNITGKKAVKSYSEEFAVATPTTGEIRLYPKVQHQLDVKDGDTIVSVTATNEDGTLTVYIAKGVAGVPEVDENGSPLIDDRGRTVYADSGYGAVVREASKGSALLKFTATVTWNELGGTEDYNRYFTLGEPVEGETGTGTKDDNGKEIMFEGIFYPLIFKEQKEKIKRSSGDEGEEEENDLDDLQEGVVEEI